MSPAPPTASPTAEAVAPDPANRPAVGAAADPVSTAAGRFDYLDSLHRSDPDFDTILPSRPEYGDHPGFLGLPLGMFFQPNLTAGTDPRAFLLELEEVRLEDYSSRETDPDVRRVYSFPGLGITLFTAEGYLEQFICRRPTTSFLGHQWIGKSVNDAEKTLKQLGVASERASFSQDHHAIHFFFSGEPGSPRHYFYLTIADEKITQIQGARAEGFLDHYRETEWQRGLGRNPNLRLRFEHR